MTQAAVDGAADDGWAPTSSRRPRRLGGASIALAGVALVVAGCLPDPKTTQGEDIANLYAVFLGAGIVVGGDRVGAGDDRDPPRATTQDAANRPRPTGTCASRPCGR